VRRCGKCEDPFDFANAPGAKFAKTGKGFDPTEDLLDSLGDSRRGHRGELHGHQWLRYLSEPHVVKS